MGFMMKEKNLPAFITNYVAGRLSDHDIALLIELIALDLAHNGNLSVVKKSEKDNYLDTGAKAIKKLSSKERVDFIRRLAENLHDRME